MIGARHRPNDRRNWNFFFDNIREQHLAHKMAFSTLAWLAYAILLWGRAREGWRGRKALRWTFAGYALLGLSYFGSKLILENILGKHWG